MNYKQIIVLEVCWSGEDTTPAAYWHWDELIDDDATVIAAGPVLDDDTVRLGDNDA